MLCVAVFSLYCATLLPGPGGGDTAELQRVSATLGLAHVPGYPLYTLLGWLWNSLIPFGNPAWRLNLFSALSAALTVGGVYLATLLLDGRTLAAMTAAAALACSRTFWEQATQAEVYAFAGLLAVVLVGAALLWRAQRLPFWVVGLLIGLNLAHHRLPLLIVPGLVGFVLLTRRPRIPELLLAAVAAALPLLFYGYVPLRAESWQDPWLLLRDYLLTNTVWEWLRPERLWGEGANRAWELTTQWIGPQFLWVGVPPTLLGALHLLRRDRASAILLLMTYLLNFVFCCAYYVPDIEIFLFVAHIIQTLLIGVGITWLMNQATQSASTTIGFGALLIPAWLLATNLLPIRSLRSAATEQQARALLQHPFAERALVLGDGFTIEGLRYLQAVEGIRPDLEFGWDVDHSAVTTAFGGDRPVYLLHFAPDLPLAQTLDGPVFRVSNAPMPELPAYDARWNEGLRLTGLQIAPGPYSAGDVVLVAMSWSADSPPTQDYILFVHIVGPDGGVISQQDRVPGNTPTSQWRAGVSHRDLFMPKLPPDTPPGAYRVIVGWYAYPSLQRLPRRDETSGAGDSAHIGTIDVGR